MTNQARVVRRHRIDYTGRMPYISRQYKYTVLSRRSNRISTDRAYTLKSTMNLTQCDDADLSWLLDRMQRGVIISM